MATIERTVYPQLNTDLTSVELEELFTPSEEEVELAYQQCSSYIHPEINPMWFLIEKPLR